jgi:hypothetical protein
MFQAIKHRGISILKHTTMKEFMNIMLKDYEKEHFTRKEIFIYGVITPSLLTIAIAIGSALA